MRKYGHPELLKKARCKKEELKLKSAEKQSDEEAVELSLIAVSGFCRSR